MASLRSITLMLLGCCCTIGCQFERPYGHYKIWGDHHSLGDSALFVERVRTDGPSNNRVDPGYTGNAGYTSQSGPPSVDGLWEDPELAAQPGGYSTGPGCEAPQPRPHIQPQTWLFRR